MEYIITEKLFDSLPGAEKKLCVSSQLGEHTLTLARTRSSSLALTP